jgi:hypothetical protein
MLETMMVAAAIVRGSAPYGASSSSQTNATSPAAAGQRPRRSG